MLFVVIETETSFFPFSQGEGKHCYVFNMSSLLFLPKKSSEK